MKETSKGDCISLILTIGVDTTTFCLFAASYLLWVVTQQVVNSSTKHLYDEWLFYINNLPVSHQFARGWLLTREVNIVNFKLLAQLTYIDIFPVRMGFNITLHFVSQIRRTAQIVTCCGKCSSYVWYSSDAAVLYEKSSVGVPGEADENWWKHQISSTYSTVNVHFPWGHLMKWEINTHLWILRWWWHTHTHIIPHCQL